MRLTSSLQLTLAILCVILPGCNSKGKASPAAASPVVDAPVDPLALYSMTGNVSPVRDPSMVRENGTYYVFTTDAVNAGQVGLLSVRCSADKINWSTCGHVFDALPAWIAKVAPAATNLWAPDISYFNGAYHVYYAASSLLSQASVIGLATNVTLDPTSPLYHWVDQGAVIGSSSGDDFNALDPNIMVDGDGSVWLNYGSFWTGIKQRRIDQSTGKLSASDSTIYSLAYRPLLDHAVEGASLVHHGAYYYLFISTGHCCEVIYQQDDYREAVGRSSSPHGPFLDKAGVDLAAGGGTVLLQANAQWNAPGGGSAYIDSTTGESLLTFHALKIGPDPTGYLWLEPLTWTSDWPSLP